MPLSLEKSSWIEMGPDGTGLGASVAVGEGGTVAVAVAVGSGCRASTVAVRSAAARFASSVWATIVAASCAGSGPSEKTEHEMRTPAKVSNESSLAAKMYPLRIGLRAGRGWLLALSAKRTGF